MKGKNKNIRAVIRRTPLDMIERAKRCNFEDMEEILHSYRGYILELCKFNLYDAGGNTYTCVDEEMYHELESKLMMAILTKFQVK